MIKPKPYGDNPPKYLIILLGQFVAFGPLSIDMYLPALPEMAQALNTTSAYMQYTLVSFFIGFCLGMLFYGPFSDLLGRRKMVTCGLSLYVIASFALVIVDNIHFFIGWRAIQAFGAGAAIVMGRAIARDVYSPEQLPKILSLMTLVTMSAPLLAPLVGGYLVYFFDFRAIFIFLTLLGAISYVIVVFVLPETIKEKSDNPNIIVVAFKNYIQLLLDKDAFGTIGVLAFSFAGMFAFVNGSPFVYIEYFGVEERNYGYLFALNVIGMIIVLLINVRLLKTIKLTTILGAQSVLMMALGVVLYLMHNASFALLVTLIVLYISFVNAIGANCLAQLLKFRPQLAGSATALAVSSQFGWAAVSGFVLSLLQDGSPFAMTFLMMVFAILSFVCFILIDKNEPTASPQAKA